MSPRITRWQLALGERNGLNRDFQTPTAYAAGSLHVLLNGQSVQLRFIETGPATFRLNVAPDPDDILEVAYEERGAFSAAADVAIDSDSRKYCLLDLVADQVPGQANTFYLDKGATVYGYNVQEDTFGTPRIMLQDAGQQLLLLPVQRWTATLGDYDLVRSQSTGPEGPAAIGSRNAIRFNGPVDPDAIIWYSYVRRSLAAA